MNYVIRPTSKDITHHGILGQKWGKRQGPPYPLDGSDHSAAEKKAGWKKSLNKGHEARSIKATANRTLAKVYGLNERVYQKSNPTLASMNAAAKKDALKRADEAQKEANKKKVDKLTAYKEKLVNRESRRIASNNESADKYENMKKDLDEYGIKSDTFKKMSREKYANADSSVKFAADLGLYSISDIRDFRDKTASRASQYRFLGEMSVKAKKELLKMPIDEFTSKHDIRKTRNKAKKSVINNRDQNTRNAILEELYGKSYNKGR